MSPQRAIWGATWVAKWFQNAHFWSKIVKKSIKKQNIPFGSDYALGWDTPSLNGNSSAGDYFSKLSFGNFYYEV